MENNCLFCSIIDGKIPAKILYEDELLVAIEDIAPQAPHHYLLIPREHIATTNDLTEAHREMVGHVFVVAAKLAKQFGIDEQGFRVVNNCMEGAGQTVWHLHFHLLGGRTMHWPPG
ncbi:histidine triad nucleotide-binding protein [Syntrophotalea acetylenivorans]|uniref:Histidine triad nucleotide-binding protein n=1 Tax=Syntrophotalea acetylenivorans TaxID=1842532 RepID=A0A1L3GNA8_9BACT|nr:histidine triad nucleotide-binding protein [Syntrophotalea acetylenivorans]APG27380.1 histidine triad nucleotide-binding protein [Syntrophotalea acetylenivorans]